MQKRDSSCVPANNIVFPNSEAMLPAQNLIDKFSKKCLNSRIEMLRNKGKTQLKVNLDANNARTNQKLLTSMAFAEARQKVNSAKVIAISAKNDVKKL